MRMIFMGAMLALIGCGDNAPACPTDTDFNGDELPCSCGGLTIEAMPGDGSACSCSPDGSFSCVAPDTGVADDTGASDDTSASDHSGS